MDASYMSPFDILSSPPRGTEGQHPKDRVPKDHLFMNLHEIIPWQRFTYTLVKYCQGKAKEGETTK